MNQSVKFSIETENGSNHKRYTGTMTIEDDGVDEPTTAPMVVHGSAHRKTHNHQGGYSVNYLEVTIVGTAIQIAILVTLIVALLLLGRR